MGINQIELKKKGRTNDVKDTNDADGSVLLFFP